MRIVLDLIMDSFCVESVAPRVIIISGSSPVHGLYISSHVYKESESNHLTMLRLIVSFPSSLPRPPAQVKAGQAG
jgi:hypothetical protein